MEKSSTPANSNVVCKKILNAFADFQKNFPFSSHPRQDPSATQLSSPENPNMPGKDSPLQLPITAAKVADNKPKSKTTKQEIPVLSNPPPPSVVQIKKTTEESKIEPKVKASEKEGDKFTDYINEAKVKMRSSTSDIGGEKQIDKRSAATSKDDSKEKFTNYISRAGKRIRTTSSNIGFGKATSVKRE